MIKYHLHERKELVGGKDKIRFKLNTIYARERYVQVVKTPGTYRKLPAGEIFLFKGGKEEGKVQNFTIY